MVPPSKCFLLYAAGEKDERTVVQSNKIGDSEIASGRVVDAATSAVSPDHGGWSAWLGASEFAGNFFLVLERDGEAVTWILYGVGMLGGRGFGMVALVAVALIAAVVVR